MNILVAADDHWSIGYRGNLLVRIPLDHQLFQKETLGKVVVMGRKTLDTLPGGQPLAGRTNLILSRDPQFQVKPEARWCFPPRAAIHFWKQCTFPE